MSTVKVCSVESCGKKTVARGWCATHWKRWRLHGDPLFYPGRNKDIENFFSDAIAYQGNDCLIWPFARYSNGYAHWRVNGKDHVVSRLICERVNGPPPTSKHQAAHSCGNGSGGCINRHHLRWATPQENASDKYMHGTHIFGEQSNFSKLSEADVLKIRELPSSETNVAIGERFGVTHSNISAIRLRKSWAHLEGGMQS